MTAFTYPVEPHLRRHGPQGYADVVSDRPWLRDEFAFRCVYCLLREQWGSCTALLTLSSFTDRFPSQRLTVLRQPGLWVLGMQRRQGQTVGP